MSMNDPDVAPDANISMNVQDDTMTLTVEVTADFVGWSSADDDTEGYGTMYIIDFESHDSASMDIQQLGTCSNRNAPSVSNMNWNEQWIYSVDPNRGVNSQNGAYINSQYWNITTADNGDCGAVKWTGYWTWYDLLECTDYAGNDVFIEITEDSEWVNMTGAVTVNLVSPLTLNSDSGTVCNS